MIGGSTLCVLLLFMNLHFMCNKISKRNQEFYAFSFLTNYFLKIMSKDLHSIDLCVLKKK